MNTLAFPTSAAFVVFCLYMARHAVLAYRRAKESDTWPAADGVLLSVELWGTRNIDGEMVAANNLRVKYDYQINANGYSGNTVAYYELHYPETTEFAEAHPEGSQVKVFYNPHNCAQSVLVPGLHPAKPYGGLILAGFGVVFSLGISAGIWLGYIG